MRRRPLPSRTGLLGHVLASFALSVDLVSEARHPVPPHPTLPLAVPLPVQEMLPVMAKLAGLPEGTPLDVWEVRVGGWLA